MSIDPYNVSMRNFLLLSIHFLCTLVKLMRPGGVRAVMAENLALKQQLITLNRRNKRSPKLTAFDRFFYGLLTFIIGEHRFHKIAVTLKPATILKFHRALMNEKYRNLFSTKSKKKPGRKPLPQAAIDLIIEMKKRNPMIGYGRISMQIFEAFGITISRFAVGRILRLYKHKLPFGGGPSWLTFIGQIKDSLWFVDLFRCESISLKSHWVMVIMDRDCSRQSFCIPSIHGGHQFTRRIIGFSVHAGDCDGVAYCRMFNTIVSGNSHPKYLSSDNDPLFRFHRWKANLGIIDVEEIKTVPYVPLSHPFVERLISTVRRKYIDHSMFFNSHDLQKKLDRFQGFYNETRGHSSLRSKTPKKMSSEDNSHKKLASLDNYRWKSHCNGLYQFPVAA